MGKEGRPRKYNTLAEKKAAHTEQTLNRYYTKIVPNKTREWQDAQNEYQRQRYKNIKSGLYHLYNKGSYVGVTNSMFYRKTRHKQPIVEQARFKDKVDALIVEAVLQRDYEYEGWHRTKAMYYYNQAKQSHKRLAKRIAFRIFTSY